MEPPRPSPDQQLGRFSRDMSLTRMVMYAGATWDWHRLHYDDEYAARAKLSGPIVDGQMFGALFAEQILDHFGPDARIERMEFRFRSLVYAGETVEVAGEVTKREPAEDGERVTCDQIITVGERTCVSGATQVLLPREPEPR